MSNTGSRSPLRNAGNGRRLSSCRRGSMAAPDPFGNFPDSERGVSSILTITRVPPALYPGQNGEGRHSRPRSADPHTVSGGRISFASTVFCHQKETGVGARSSSVGHGRPLSPRALPRSNSFAALPQLTPTQIYEMAQHCKSPQSQPLTPAVDSLVPPTPISFTPLPDSIHLPFIDRPSEVQALMSSAPTAKMFSLLSQTLFSSAEGDADPKTWSYVQLERWLTNVDRDEADDMEWVAKARACITARSEPIWERVKGALGVPPELDEPLVEATNNVDIVGPDGVAPNDFDFSGDAWVEPILPSPGGSSTRPPYSPTTDFRRSPSLSRQSVCRMEGISEEASPPPSSPPAIQGLRIVTAPSSLTGCREITPSPTSAGSFSQPHVPYDVVADRGPGHPLFPSSFANLALGPTLSANNPALRSPTVPPASAYPFSHSISRHGRVPSWAEGWDPQNQEYAVSIVSGSSTKRSVTVDVHALAP